MTRLTPELVLVIVNFQPPTPNSQELPQTAA